VGPAVQVDELAHGVQVIGIARDRGLHHGDGRVRVAKLVVQGGEAPSVRGLLGALQLRIQRGEGLDEFVRLSGGLVQARGRLETGAVAGAQLEQSLDPLKCAFALVARLEQGRDLAYELGEPIGVSGARGLTLAEREHRIVVARYACHLLQTLERAAGARVGFERVLEGTPRPVDVLVVLEQEESELAARCGVLGACGLAQRALE